MSYAIRDGEFIRQLKFC